MRSSVKISGKAPAFWVVGFGVLVCAGMPSANADIAIETVLVGNTGNSADDTGYGAVDYVYSIGKYEVTAGQYAAFLNAVAVTDTYALYDTSMSTNSYGCKIERSGASGSYSYSVANDWADRPVNYISWGDAARFANWMHNGQPTGDQTTGTTEDGAYALNGATTNEALMLVVRETGATWALPNENEWYKAAYHKNDGDTGNYFDYPTSSDIQPAKNAPPGDANSANYYYYDYALGSPYYRNEMGAYTASVSPYDTYDQAGNIAEWTEGVSGDSRVVQGGSFRRLTGMSADTRESTAPNSEGYISGFRIVNVPEPATLSALAIGAFALLRQPRQSPKK